MSEDQTTTDRTDKDSSQYGERTPVDTPWAVSVDDVLSQLDVDIESGLSGSDTGSRRKKYGRNEIGRIEKKSLWTIFVDQFKSLVILLLAVASAVSFVIGQWVEGVAVAAAIFVNTVIGFVTELKAVRSMEALQQLSRVTTRVRRDGEVDEIPSSKLVVGDIVLLEAGDLVPADLRLYEANKLQIDEAALTGESVTVTKQTESVDADAPLAERKNMAFKGTAVQHGSGGGVVTAVGKGSELGNIQEMTREAEEEITPLENRLNALAHRLIYITLALAATVAVIGLLKDRDTALMIKSAVALAVAAIPEGLPIVATVALARGMYVMAKRNAVVKRLASVETLGATSVIGTDKTGTLTENKMTVNRVFVHDTDISVEQNADATFTSEDHDVDPDDHTALRESIRIGVLCNNASLKEESDDNDGNDNGAGDPMEVALLALGRSVGFNRPDMLEDMPEAREEAFDAETKMMATFHEQEDGFFVAIKGAPEAVIEHCATVMTEDGTEELTDDDRKMWQDRNDELAADGLRLLAMATRETDSKDADPYEDLTLVGLVGLLDPVRRDVPDAIAECHRAGVRVVMVTGDQKGTAGNIAREAGLTEADDTDVRPGSDIKAVDDLSDDEQESLVRTHVFARVSPRQKLNLVDIHQKQGSVVAMIGDGVNDAPALKEADIGVAMGQKGTQVAKEAADMILRDDAFPTIVAAVRHGRLIFENIRKFVVYLLSGNAAEIVAVAAASMFALPLPLLPLQILLLNVVLDVFPALAMGLGSYDPGLMDRPPRPREEAVLTRERWITISAYGAIIAAVVLLSLLVALHWLNMPAEDAVSVSFLTLALSRLWHVFNMRDDNTGVFRNEITRNGFVWIAIAISLAILGVVVYAPGISQVLSLTPLGTTPLLVAFGLSLVPLIIGQIAREAGLLKV